MSLPTVAYRLIGRFSVTRVVQVLHPFLYRRTGGRGMLGRVLGSEMLILSTVGRRSGQERSVALFAFPVGRPAGSWAVVGSRGGSRRVPAWYHNLQADPRVAIQVRGLHGSARPREAFGDEYEAIFEQAASAYPGYRLYRTEATHHIPIVVLEPNGPPAGSSAPAGPEGSGVSM